jgi:ech hydrogenase subunit D
MIEAMNAITAERLIPETTRLKDEGYRLVTLTGDTLPEETFQIIYTFDRNYELVHLVLSIPAGQIVPSISPVYWAAFLVENELQDLFGLRFQGLALDYERTLFLEDPEQDPPFNRQPGQGD